MSQKLLSPEEIATQAGSAMPFLHLPQRESVFADRAARLRRLAPGHAMADYLEFIAIVADAQHALLQDMPPVFPPSPAAIEHSNTRGVPPLDAQVHARDSNWRDGLRRLSRAVAAATSGRQREVVACLEGSRDELYEAQASKLLAGITLGLDVATAPLIGAGLQVYFTHLAVTLGEQAFPRLGVATLCPCCGSRPVASIVRIGANESGYRFLHCALCNAEWHMVRIKCSNCESTKGIGYLALDDGVAADRKVIKAEVCDECGTYLKLCAMNRDPFVDPVADDLATLPLDILVADTGKRPSGVNFMLIHGDPGLE